MSDVEWAMCQNGAASGRDERPDEELVNAYRHGDGAAFEVLFQRYFDRVVKLAGENMGKDLRATEESKDVALSVFESVWMRGRVMPIEVDSDEGLWPLLITITLNKLRNRARYWARKRRARRRQKRLDDHDPLETGDTPPEDVAEFRELVEKLLGQFNERRQKIVELLLQELPVKEIACLVGCAKRTVYRTRKAAKDILKQIWEES